MDVPIKGINSEEVKLARDLSTGRRWTMNSCSYAKVFGRLRRL